MKKRSQSWKNPNLSPKSGVLAKYKKTVQSASKGAITD
jgi:dihydroxy-acid dehydratase